MDNPKKKFSFDAIAGARWPFVALFFFVFLLTHVRQNAINNYGCELCSDKAGYYMYLPATFQYGFHASDYPAGEDAAHGYGFHLDTVQNKAVTKFTCGVAILQAPFYLVGKLFSSIFAPEESPYSRFYLLFLNIGAAFYCTLGLFFLHRWFASHSSKRTAFIAVLITLFGTHLYYYTLDESMMSHVYSFFLLCTLLYARMRYEENTQTRFFVLLAAVAALAILIRPTNVLFVPIVLLVDVNNRAAFRNRLKILFTPKNVTIASLITFIIFLPQLLYWKFAYGKYLAWSYTDEGFFNWKSPWLMTTWFSPQSGLFPYTPVLLITLGAAILLRKRTNALLIVAVFLVMSYLCASWSNPFFGECNFGKRPMVEYLPLLMLPAVWMLDGVNRSSAAKKWTITTLLALCVLYNLWLFNAFDTCFGGAQWEWSRFVSYF